MEEYTFNPGDIQGKTDVEQIKLHLKLLNIAAKGLVEIRSLGKGRLIGLFDNTESLASEVLKENSNFSHYISLNPRKNDYWKHPLNKLVRSNYSAKVENVVCRSNLLIDIDSVRPGKVNATAVEKEAAYQVYLKTTQYLKDRSIQFFSVDSGNGYHILIALPNYAIDDSITGKIKLLLKWFSRTFGDDAAKLDTIVYDAPRIERLAGTLNIKYPHTEDRPQRMARLIETSPITPVDILEVMSAEISEQRAIDAEKPKDKACKQGSKIHSKLKGDLRTLDIVRLFKDHGLYRKMLSEGEGKHSVTCPWENEHSCGDKHDTSTVIWEAKDKSWPGFFCFHNSCSERGISDLIEYFGSGTIDNLCSEKYHGKDKNDYGPKRVALFEGLVDVCADDNGKPVFLCTNGDQLEAIYEVNINGETLQPPPADAMPWKLPKAKEVIAHYNESDRTLFNDIVEQLKANCELPDGRLYQFIAAWILHTHLIDKFNYSPVLIFFAVLARGKTRTSRLILFMSRRGLQYESVRQADLIRKAERFESVVFFDVKDIWKKAEDQGSEDIILGRFDRGMIVSRVTNFDKRGFEDTQHFKCFGPTIIATNEPAHHLLESRGITIVMRPASRQFDNDVREQDLLGMRERAVAFRARWMTKDLPVIKKPANDRLGDITRPIIQIITAIVPELLDDMLGLIKSFEEERKDDLSETKEGKIVAIVIKLKDAVVNGWLATERITEEINIDVHVRYQRSPASVGKSLTALGFQMERKNMRRGIKYDENLIMTLAGHYGLTANLTDTSGSPDTIKGRRINVNEVIDDILSRHNEGK